MNVILVAVISVGVIALVAALVLYLASKKFAVYEDPRIAQVAEVLPQANCGGCGFPGCSGLASAIVKNPKNLWLLWCVAMEHVLIVRISTSTMASKVVLLHQLFMAVKRGVVLAV